MRAVLPLDLFEAVKSVDASVATASLNYKAFVFEKVLCVLA